MFASIHCAMLDLSFHRLAFQKLLGAIMHKLFVLSLLLVPFLSPQESESQRRPAEHHSFSVDYDDPRVKSRHSVRYAIRHFLESSPNQLTLNDSLWFYDCKGGRIVRFDNPKRQISVVVLPLAEELECELVRLEVTDFQALSINLNGLREIHSIFMKQGGMTSAPPFAVRATTVYSLEEVRRLTKRGNAMISYSSKPPSE